MASPVLSRSITPALPAVFRIALWLNASTSKSAAAKVIAVDNDELCYENGIENVNNNNVGKIVEVKIGEIESINDSDFDLIIANINKHILIDIGSKLTGKLKQGGPILLSGLLVEDKDDVSELYKKPLSEREC